MQQIDVCAACLTRPRKKGVIWKVCSGCKTVGYCTVDCQKQHWKQHKTICKALQAEAAEATRKAEAAEAVENTPSTSLALATILAKLPMLPTSDKPLSSTCLYIFSALLCSASILLCSNSALLFSAPLCSLVFSTSALFCYVIGTLLFSLLCFFTPLF